MVQRSPLVPEVLEAPAVDKQTVRLMRNAEAYCIMQKENVTGLKVGRISCGHMTVSRAAGESKLKLFSVKSYLK